MAEELVEQVADQVADQIEDVATATRLLTGREVGFFFAGAGIGIAGGFAVGYFVIGKRLKTKYEKIADDEISKMKEHYRQLTIALEGEAERRRPLEELVVERGYATTTEVKSDKVREYTEAEQRAIDETNAKFPADGEEEEEASDGSPAETEDASKVKKNVFKEEDSNGWDYSVETRGRTSDVPYIIHIDEFRENEVEHEQVTYTYYEQDDVLADARDTIIEDMDAVIGLGNLGRWGHGSNDPNITYVRNEELRIDAEILRDRGSFHETVHAIRHSSERRRSSERGFDDEQ